MADERRIDGTKIQFHPYRVTQWLDGKDDWGLAKSIYPIYVEVSPVGACNHRCTFCAVDYIGYKAISPNGALLRDRLREMGELGVKSVMFAGEGEPLLHKEINACVLAAIGTGIDVAFTTNGVLLNKLETLDVCSWVKVSLNAGTKETYAKVHRTKEKDWDIVWENLRSAVLRKGDCEIGVQMVGLPENIGEFGRLEEMCAEIGIDYCVLKPYSQHKYSVNKLDWKPTQLPNPKYAGTVVRENAIKTEAIPYDKCQATPYLWAYIMASGDVYSCSAYLLDERFRLGNINTESFRDIWEGDKRRANWQFVREGLSIHECRVNCRMNQTNIHLNELVNPSHGVNFL